MDTKRIVFLFLSVLGTQACAADEERHPRIGDQTWDELTTSERQLHLEEKLDANLHRLRAAETAQEWHAAAGEAVRALSLLRVEGGIEDARAYAELELEVERLTDEPPSF